MPRPPTAPPTSPVVAPLDWRVRLGVWLRCREAASLILAALDRPISLRQRMLLRLHLGVCDACTRFDGQVRLMNKAMGPWRTYADSGEPADPPAGVPAKPVPPAQ